MVQAGALAGGEQLLGTGAGRVTVKGARSGSVSPPTNPEVVYNLTVAGAHTYQVGAAGVLVHNTDCKIPKPQVEDGKLKNLVNNLYKHVDKPDSIGNGTTVNALRIEQRTGQPVGGTFHETKRKETVSGLRNWLRRNPNTNPRDKLVANSLLRELESLAP